jgi:hypothetical protein
VKANIETTQTSVVIPPGAPQAGESYVVQVNAITGVSMPSGGASVVRSPLVP